MMKRLATLMAGLLAALVCGCGPDDDYTSGGLGFDKFVPVYNGYISDWLQKQKAEEEKARDYIAATRVLGASTWRIMFRHLLPN